VEDVYLYLPVSEINMHCAWCLGFSELPKALGPP